jgi:topoisomerase IA-like protein
MSKVTAKTTLKEGMAVKFAKQNGEPMDNPRLVVGVDGDSLTVKTWGDVNHGRDVTTRIDRSKALEIVAPDFGAWRDGKAEEAKAAREERAKAKAAEAKANPKPAAKAKARKAKAAPEASDSDVEAIKARNEVLREAIALAEQAKALGIDA